MKLRICICFLTILFLGSCKPQKDVKFLITNGNYKYWLRPNAADYRGRDLTFYYFDSKGQWLLFKKSLDGSFRNFDSGDVYFEPTWELQKDSIQIGDNRLKIESINKDTFSMSGILLVAAPSLIPVEYQKMQ